MHCCRSAFHSAMIQESHVLFVQTCAVFFLSFCILMKIPMWGSSLNVYILEALFRDRFFFSPMAYLDPAKSSLHSGAHSYVF